MVREAKVRSVVFGGFAAVLLIQAFVAPRGVTAEKGSPAAIRAGEQAPSFSLTDYRGVPWSSESAVGKPVVVAFLGIECPLVRLYASRLQELATKYGDRGVQFVGINSNQQDSLSELGHFARSNEIRFPLLKDVGNQVADQFGAERTPEVFLLDGKGKVRYHGRIDDQYTYGVQKTKVGDHYLVEALDAVLAGREVARPETEVVGCHIGRLLTGSPRNEVTYARQISRILNARCVQCHRDGEIGPFSLTNYQETVGWAEMIAEVVRERRMPPWHADPAHGQFANDARLSAEEQRLIQAWVADGAPEGNPADLPPAPKFVSGWRIGQPDMVITMADKPYAVPATGEVRYQYFMVDPGFREDKWVRAAECRPGNRAVVHHIIVAAGGRERLAQRFQGDAVSDWLAATAPGSLPMVLPPGYAKRIPAGSKIVFQMHYTPNGKATEDLSSIGLIFADPKEVRHEVMTHKAANQRFQIPPGAAAHRVEATYRFEEDSLMLAMFPHMHLRGKSFRYTAQYPDGREEVLLDVPRYDFNWQNAYAFAESKRMPAGTKIHCVAHFDNSADNWANPDPSATVRWGDQTWEEMMIGYFDMSPVREVSLTSTPAAPVVDRVAQFERLAKAGPLAVSAQVQETARGATASSEAWKRLGAALQAQVPQLDRVCWMSVADGKLSVRRVSQALVGRRGGGEGLEVPAENLLLARYAQGTATVTHGDISKIDSPDFRLLTRLFASSVHVPAKLDGKPGVISFWSVDADAFSPAAIQLLEKVAQCVD